jgi:solute carrier family 35 (adenosine 3'-phospho 5'-phosphosulfate transporter), member B3
MHCICMYNTPRPHHFTLAPLNISLSPSMSSSSDFASTTTSTTSMNKNNNMQHLLSWSTSWSDFFDRLPSSMQFSILVAAVCLFFGLHNLLQEAIMQQMQHQFGVMLGYTEVLGVAICSFIERHYIVRERDRTAPYSAYTLLTCCLVASSAMSNISLNYINFPTKVCSTFSMYTYSHAYCMHNVDSNCFCI